MKRNDWLTILDVLTLPVCCLPNFSLLSKRFRSSILPLVSHGMLLSSARRFLTALTVLRPEAQYFWARFSFFQQREILPLMNHMPALLKSSIAGSVSEETLGSIYSQENQHRLIQRNRRLQEQYHVLHQRCLQPLNVHGRQCKLF